MIPPQYPLFANGQIMPQQPIDPATVQGQAPSGIPYPVFGGTPDLSSMLSTTNGSGQGKLHSLLKMFMGGNSTPTTVDPTDED